MSLCVYLFVYVFRYVCICLVSSLLFRSLVVLFFIDACVYLVVYVFRYVRMKCVFLHICMYFFMCLVVSSVL